MTSIEKDCYRIIQEIAVAQDPVCIVCCHRKSKVGHHLFTRSRHATAFHPEAVRGMCHICHQEAHDERKWFKNIMVEMIGDRYYELERLSRTVCKPDFKDVRSVLRMRLAALLKRQQGQPEVPGLNNNVSRGNTLLPQRSGGI